MSVEDGALTGQTTADNPAKGNTFLIWRGGRPANFELKCEFRMPNHGFANSGVQFRSWEEPKKWGRWAVGGYQADMDDTGKYVGDLYCERDRGQVAKCGQKVVIGDDHQGKVVGSVGDPAELLAKWKKYEWNDYDILADGNHIVLKINGYVTADVIDNDKKLRRFDGIIALQLHAGDPMKVQFRNLRLKKLPSSKPARRDGASGAEPGKKIVFFAGPPSHGYAEHEYYAGAGCWPTGSAPQCRRLTWWWRGRPGRRRSLTTPTRLSCFATALSTIRFCRTSTRWID